MIWISLLVRVGWPNTRLSVVSSDTVVYILGGGRIVLGSVKCKGRIRANDTVYAVAGAGMGALV